MEKTKCNDYNRRQGGGKRMIEIRKEKQKDHDEVRFVNDRPVSLI
ncbi:MAG: hypothetical protein PVJ60_06485 [Phycisphaerales bacterium]